MQLWPPLSRRLLDSDPFARASALAALKAASKVDAPFFTKKVMDQVWPLLNARAHGGDAGALHAIFAYFLLRHLTVFAEALAGLADIVRSFPESTTLPVFAAALALWCERRCKTLPLLVVVYFISDMLRSPSLAAQRSSRQVRWQEAVGNCIAACTEVAPAAAAFVCSAAARSHARLR